MTKRLSIIVALLLSVASLFAAEREVLIDCPWGTISATLTTPESATETALLIVAGSGPTDRNGNSSLNLNTFCYKMLSDNLTAQGYAVLRYDKRGIGRSHLPAEATEETLTFDDYVADARRCVEYLRGQGYRHIVVVGHSEGGNIALHLSTEPSAVDAAVLLCASGYPIDVILLRQLSSQLMPAHIGLMLRAEAIIRSLKQSVRVAEEVIPQELLALFRPSVQPFLISQMQSDPQALAAESRCPMLIITGGHDIQVTPDNGEVLAEAAPEARHITIERMSHVLKTADSNDRMEQLLSVYTNSQLPLSEGLTAEIAAFLRHYNL